jgi:hypothetical protein
VLRVDYTEKNKGVGWIEIGRSQTSSGAPSDDATGDLYARSEHTAGWVKIPSGGQILSDAQKLIAAP